MKTYLECVREAADKMNATGTYNSYQAILDFIAPILQTAADIYTEQSNSHKHSVVRGAVTSHCISNDIHNCPFTETCPECTKPATEPLPAEGREKPCADGHWFATEYMNQRPAQCIVCGHWEM